MVGDASIEKLSEIETIIAFMERMWTQDLTKLSEMDASTLMSLATIGAQEMIKLVGTKARVPNSTH